MLTSRAALAAILAVLMLPGAASAASIWTPVDSGLGAGATDIITAVEYQGPDRFWYATGSGKLRYRAGNAFATPASPAGGTVAGTSFNDIAFKPGTSTGIAVGTAGHVWRTTDGGQNWSRISFTDFASSYNCNDDIGGNQNVPTETNPALALYAVVWGPGDRVFVVGEKGVVLRSTNAGASFQDINRQQIVEPGFPTYRQVKCQLEGTIYDLEPLAVADSTPNDQLPIYFLASGYVYFSSNGLTSEPARRTDFSCSNGQEWLAIDPVNPARQWGTTAGNAKCLYLTEDDGTYQSPRFPNVEAGEVHELREVATAGTPLTVMVVGKAGDVFNSINGKDFYLNPAEGTAKTQDWYATDGYDTNHFAIGGGAGQLQVTDRAASIPDFTAPTGTIGGPSSGVVDQPLTFTAALADEAGGSGINGAATNWTTPGLPSQSGNQATFSFPAPGTYTVTVGFADNAGNAGSATRSVTIRTGSPEVPPQTLPVPTLPGSTQPPITGGGAKKKGKYVVLKVKGKLGLPAGVSAAQGCNGTMSISVYKGKKRLVGKTTKVKSTCGYKKTIKVKRSKVGKAKKLKLKVAFKGNAVLAPLSSTYKVKVKR